MTSRRSALTLAGGVEQKRLAEGGFELAGLEPGGCRSGEGVGGRQQGRGGVVVLRDGDVDGEDGEQRGGERVGVAELEGCVHRTMVPRWSKKESHRIVTSDLVCVCR